MNPQDRINVRVNGETKQIPAQTTVTDLLDLLSLPHERIAIEKNRTLLPRADFGKPLAEGDTLEIVTFVGGG